MCRYHRAVYKRHYACFKCRKAFKQPALTDLVQWALKENRVHGITADSISKISRVYRPLEYKRYQELFGEIHQRDVKCPQCGELMEYVGRDFKAPPQKSVKDWAILKGLFTVGIHFESCGCYAMGFIPKSKPEYIDFLKQKRNEYFVRYSDALNAQNIEKSKRKQDVLYWEKCVKRVDYVLSQVCSSGQYSQV